MALDLDNFLNAVPATVYVPEPDTLSEEQFEALTKEIEELRTKISAGGLASLEESRKIVIWFRSRRKRNFTVQKVKVVKEKVPRTPRGSGKRVKASDQDALSLLADL